jgi:nucleoid-associated protein YgaU
LGDEQSAVPPAEAVPPESVVAPTETAPGVVIPPGASAQPGGPPSPAESMGPAEGDVPAGKRSAPDARRTHGLGTHLPTRARYTSVEARSDAGAPASSQRVSDGAGAPPIQPSAGPANPGSVAPVALKGVSSPVTTDDPALAGRPASYVVQPGDSLWSIAQRLLGRDASAGRVAREVNRLWSLNRSRIATGDPDLLMVGTRLELR